MSPSSPVSSERTVVLLRHAKAEPYGDEDHARRLTARGQQAATAVGAWLAAQDLVPTHAIVSSAVRTRTTWERLAAAAGCTVTPDVSDAAYSAGPETALDLLRGAPAEARVLLFVGHNPTVSSLVHLLDDGEPDPDAFRAVGEGLPTAACAVLDVHVPWADLDLGEARLVGFHVDAG